MPTATKREAETQTHTVLSVVIEIFEKEAQQVRVGVARLKLGNDLHARAPILILLLKRQQKQARKMGARATFVAFSVAGHN